MFNVSGSQQTSGPNGSMTSCMPGTLIGTQGLGCAVVDMKEICILFEDAPPEPLIVNVQGLNEMLRITRAANLQRDFKIVQPAFFAHIPPFLQSTTSNNAFPILELKELSIIFEDATPEGYVLNPEAISEIMRIARNSHMNKDFKIMHPAFFGLNPAAYQKPMRQNILTTPNLPSQILAQGDFSSSTSVNSQPSTSHSSYASGSSRSVDSNISQSSFGTQRLHFTPLNMGNIDEGTARLLANLETQKRHIELRIRRTEEDALARAYCQYKDFSQSDTELHKSKHQTGLVERFLILNWRCYFSSQDLYSDSSEKIPKK